MQVEASPPPKKKSKIKILKSASPPCTVAGCSGIYLAFGTHNLSGLGP